MIERLEFAELNRLGYRWQYPHEVVEIFENQIASYCGAPFAVAVDSATHALELSLRYLGAGGKIQVPCYTYPSVPMMIHRIGAQIQWKQEEWTGSYQLDPWPVRDSAVELRPASYSSGSFTCLSFQKKKRLAIGRGGMILLDDRAAYDWLRKARHDGRTPGVFWHDDLIDMMGWHYYMTPEDAARGILLFRQLESEIPPSNGWRDYRDLRDLPVFAELSNKVLGNCVDARV